MTFAISVYCDYLSPMIRKCLILTLVGCLAVISQAAPYMSECSVSGPQHPFVRKDHTEIIIGDGKRPDGTPILGRKIASADELEEHMESLIETEMGFRFDPPPYIQYLLPEVGCFNIGSGGPPPPCDLSILSTPIIEVIPTKRLSENILCTTETCTIGYHDTVTISTTHSEEVGLSAETSSMPFGMGVSFTVSTSLGFSETNEESATYSYEFNLRKGEKGYIGIVNAQISANIRVTGHCVVYKDKTATCNIGRKVSKEGYHEVVIKENNKPVGFVAFIHI
ncbi:hypothetical protein BKA57DRAFT_456207 [Linnemannia elongata]|nr:hypothetical protein BKA57DRAFT_456207 [Linnemannia elongata]